MKKFLCGILTAVTCLMLVACTPSTVEKAEEKMKEAGYKVVAYNKDDAEGLQGGIIATSGLIGGNTMTALYFESSDAAKDYYESLGEDTKAVKDGKWVYWGDEAAIKAFKK